MNPTPEQLDLLKNAAWIQNLGVIVNEYTDAEPPDEKMLNYMIYNSAVWSFEKEGAHRPGMYKGVFVEPVSPHAERPDLKLCAVCYVSPAIYAQIEKAQEAIDKTVFPY